MCDGQKNPPNQALYVDTGSKREKNNGLSDDNSSLGAPSPEGEPKRQRNVSTSSGGSSGIAALSISPPNFVSFEEILKTANDMSRMALVNEIVLNKDFKLERKDNEEAATTSGPVSVNDLESAVRRNVQKAFWQILSAELAQDPPNYKQAVCLVGEVKEKLLSLLMPHHTQLREEIKASLDIDLINQQIEADAFDFRKLAHYVLHLCSRLCCPARDETVKGLMKVDQIVPLFKGILELLEVMNLDIANFYIQQFRPHIQQASIEYEREKFENLIATQKKYNIDVLEFTTKWLRRNFDALDLNQEAEVKSITNKILTSAYLELLKCIDPAFAVYQVDSTTKDAEDDYPETLLLFRARFEPIRERVFKATLISSVFAVTFAAIGEPLQSVKLFRTSLKQQLEVIIAPSGEDKPHSSASLSTFKTDELRSLLASVSLQVIKSIEQAVEKYNPVDKPSSSSSSSSPPIDQNKLESLKDQIVELAARNNRIRLVMERRILEFIERVLSSSTTVAPVQVPVGLSTFSTELTQISGDFTRLVTYNRAVYSPYYSRIIAELLAPSGHSNPPHCPQDVA